MSRLKTPLAFAFGGVVGYLYSLYPLDRLLALYTSNADQQGKDIQDRVTEEVQLKSAAIPKLLKIESVVESPIQTVSYPNFKILYSRTLRIPLAVEESIRKEYTEGTAERSNVFFVERQIPSIYRSRYEHFRETQSYKKLNLSRGHMSAAGNFNFSRPLKDNTFTYANIIPQDSDNNEDTWLTFETYQRDLTSRCDSVDIISGPVFKPSRPDSEENIAHPILRMQYNILDVNGPAVPTHLYKIIKCNQKDGKSHVSAFQFKNRYSYDNKKPMKSFQVSLEYLQKITGLQFKFDEVSSLVEFDSKVFELTKEEYNKRVIQPKILNAKTYDEVESDIRRLKSHKLKQSDDISVKLDELVTRKLSEQQPDSCKKVLSYLSMQSNLRRYKYLNGKIQDKIKGSIDEGVRECRDKELLEKIKVQMGYAVRYYPIYSEKIAEIESRLQKEFE